MNHNVKTAAVSDVTRVLAILNSIYPLSSALRAEAYSSMVAFELEKDDVLLEEGGICQYVYFITKGALRAYSNHKGKTITTYISIENEFVSSISGLHGVKPSKEGIVAVEPTSLIAIHSDILQAMFLKYFELNFIFRVFMEEYYRHAQERAYIIRLGDVKERYLYFVETKPGYVERLPLEHVASFLDMKPNTLLRIIKEFKMLSVKDQETELRGKLLHIYMHENEPYKDKMITLGTLAKALDTSAHKLSALLNNYYHLNFVDFINTYRINCIKEQMSVPGNLQNFTIEALAQNAGFSSRSSFYNAFKKAVGMSPVMYAQSIKFESQDVKRVASPIRNPKNDMALTVANFPLSVAPSA